MNNSTQFNFRVDHDTWHVQKIQSRKGLTIWGIISWFFNVKRLWKWLFGTDCNPYFDFLLREPLLENAKSGVLDNIPRAILR